MTYMQRVKLQEARQILVDLDMPEQQRNDRTAFVLLAMCDVRAEVPWSQARANVLGTTPAMKWMGEHYPDIPKGRNGEPEYAWGSRESVRKYSIHQLVAAGVLQENVDDPTRAVNSGSYVYRATNIFIEAVRTYGTPDWPESLEVFHLEYARLRERWALEREAHRIPLEIDGVPMTLSAGPHSELIAAVVSQFAPQYIPGAEVLYLGDTGSKWAVERPDRLAAMGVSVDPHGKMPDVILYDGARQWLVLVEAVTSVGPMNPKRIDELRRLFDGLEVGVVYVTAFADRATYRKFAPEIAWETEVWIQEAPTHLIHYNGERFLGPYN